MPELSRPLVGTDSSSAADSDGCEDFNHALRGGGGGGGGRSRAGACGSCGVGGGNASGSDSNVSGGLRTREPSPDRRTHVHSHPARPQLPPPPTVMQLLRSPPFLAIAALHFAHNWGWCVPSQTSLGHKRLQRQLAFAWALCESCNLLKFFEGGSRTS
jgi:hypothetical protein